MPSKKKKYNSRFPPARIKKIMQSDEEVGKVAQVVPIIISKSLEMFVGSLLESSSDITRSRNARTLTPTHIKQSILSTDEFKFLREIAQTIPDVNPGAEGEEEEGAVNTNTSGGQQIGAQSIQRRVSENRNTTATTSAEYRLSATGQMVLPSFSRGRGRPRKRLIVESQTSVRSIEEPEDDDETEEEDDDEEDADEEEDHNSDNNNRINSNQQIVNNNTNNLSDNNFNSSNNFSVNNANYYYSSTQQTNPSPYVSTIQSMATSSAASLKPKLPAIEEDDDYDN